MEREVNDRFHFTTGIFILQKLHLNCEGVVINETACLCGGFILKSGQNFGHLHWNE